MAPRIRDKDARSPRIRVEGEATRYYPGEAARILGLDLDYRQLRALLKVVGPRQPRARKWAQLTFRDLVAIRTAARLVYGSTTSGRITISKLKKICKLLQQRYGIQDPLTQVVLERQGKEVVVALDGMKFEPLTGQCLIVAGKAADYLAQIGASQAARIVKREATDGRLLFTRDSSTIKKRVRLV